MKTSAAIIATILIGVPAACAQPLWDSFDQYHASPEGEPLAGQGAWTLPAGAELGWSVYTHAGNPFGLERPFGSLRFAAGIGDGTVVAAEHPLSIGFRESATLTTRVAVRFTGRPPTGREIGRISLEPLGESASAALVAHWSDPSGERWNASLLWYDESGREQITAVFTDLEAGAWHEWEMEAQFWNNRISLRFKAPGQLLYTHAASAEWYLAGGAAGGLPVPDAVRLSAGEAGQVGSALAVDLLTDGPSRCYEDCDQDGELTFFDFLCFQTRFAVGDPYADCDGSGRIDWFDFLCFQNHFAGSCGP